MLRLTEIKLPIDHAEPALKAAILRRLNLRAEQLIRHAIYRRGIDARKRDDISFIYTIDVEVADEPAVLKRNRNNRHIAIAPDISYHFVAKAPPNLASRPVIIGTGPCGLFAGLVLAQMGFRPIILERGKAVRERTKDTFGLWRTGVLNPESNVQFGEGGAGTFSDGKLYSQIKDPKFHGRKVLDEFVKAGAPPEIMYVSKPHIGTFKLVGIVETMRATIESLGGEIRFQSRVDDIEIEDAPSDVWHGQTVEVWHGQAAARGGLPVADEQGASPRANGSEQPPARAKHSTAPSKRVRAVILSNGERIEASHVILAVGHSARDTFAMLHSRGVFIEPKPFSIGFRIEHPQSLIDKCRYGNTAGHPMLGAADYKLVHHCKNGRSVYSFCMCPGGTVVAAASEVGRVVTNGMSQYSRNERNANAGIVVGVTPEDFPGFPADPLAGVAFQRQWETKAFELGGSNYNAPGQTVGDFLAGKPSTHFGEVTPSYTPGVTPTDLSAALPDYAITAIREALRAFANEVRAFDLKDAVLTGVETRTSSPIRITRGDDFQSLSTRGLFPAGEGAGYAGGILSAAVDGIKVAEAVALSMTSAPPSSRRDESH